MGLRQRMGRLSLRKQLVGSTVLLAMAVMIVLVAGTQAVLELAAHREIASALDSRASVAMDVLRGSDQIQPDDLEPGTRVYDANGYGVVGTLAHAVTPKADAVALQVLRDGVARTAEAPGEYRLRATPYMTASGTRGVVVVTKLAEPYEDTERIVFIVMILLGLTVVGLAGAIAARVTRAALQPVRQMAERASDWSEHDLAHRFALGPPTNELAALGETLDHLLDRVAMAIRSEQRLTSELAHELRTPLTAIRGSAEIALMRPNSDPDLREDLEEIAAAARRMNRVITTLLELARLPGDARGAAKSQAVDVVARVTPLVGSELRLDVDLDETLPPIGAPEDLVVRALAPLVENAARHAASAVGIRVSTVGADIEVAVTDDGAGVDNAVRDRLFEPGASGRGGTGLGLGIARRVARSLGGEVALADGDLTEFVLVLPRG